MEMINKNMQILRGKCQKGKERKERFMIVKHLLIYQANNFITYQAKNCYFLCIHVIL